MRHWRCVAATTVVWGILVALGGLAFIYSGLFNVAATEQHGRLVNWVLHTTALHSIRPRAASIEAPKLFDEATVARGFDLFRNDCAQCHGAPGLPPEPFAMGLTPGAPRLMQVGREWSPRDIYWVVAHGIKMTAMPAWEFRMPPSDMWAVVAFVRTLPSLSPGAYKAMVERAAEPGTAKSEAQRPETPRQAHAATVAPASDAGAMALQQYACASCHVIPGIVAPAAFIGPPLTAMGKRQYIAGLLANTPRNMALWVRHPQQVKAGTAMPDMGVSEQHAREIAAYLEALR